MTPERRTAKFDPGAVRPPHPDPREGKRDPIYIQSLARDILTRGLRHPPFVTLIDGVPTTVTGEHRRLAMVQLGWKEAEFVVVEGGLTPADVAIEQYQESQLHKGFKPVEQATLLQRIMAEKGWTRGQVCEHLAVDESTVSKLFRILTALDPSLHADVDAGRLPYSHAYLIATVPDPAKQVELAERVKAGLCTREALEKRVKEHLRSRPSARRPDPTSLAGEGGLVVRYPGERVADLLAALSALVEKVKRVAKKDDPLDLLPLLMKRS